MSTQPSGRSYGVGIDLGPAPYEMYSYEQVHGADVSAAYGANKDYNLKFLFTPMSTLVTQSTLCKEWADLVNAGDANWPEGYKWRAVNQFPTVEQYDADFNFQSSVRMYAGTGAGLSGACNIQQVIRDTFPASFTYIMPFIYKRPVADGNVRTLMSSSRLAGTANWFYLQRVSSSFDKLVYCPDQVTLSGSVNSYQFSPLVEGSLHLAVVSMQDSTKKSELWLDGVMVSQFTHSGGVDSNGQLLSLGSLSNGSSALDERFGTVALSSIPMAARSGVDLVYGDMLQGLQTRLKNIYGITT